MDVVTPFIEREHVRVVEGLVATIKALPRPPASRRFGLIHAERLDEYRDAVLAVVEAAGRGVGDG